MDVNSFMSIHDVENRQHSVPGPNKSELET
jgi:hypothetical protein